MQDYVNVFDTEAWTRVHRWHAATMDLASIQWGGDDAYVHRLMMSHDTYIRSSLEFSPDDCCLWIQFCDIGCLCTPWTARKSRATVYGRPPKHKVKHHSHVYATALCL